MDPLDNKPSESDFGVISPVALFLISPVKGSKQNCLRNNILTPSVIRKQNLRFNKRVI